MREQLIDLTRLLRRQRGKNILQICIRTMPIEPRRLDKFMTAATRFPISTWVLMGYKR